MNDNQFICVGYVIDANGEQKEIVVSYTEEALLADVENKSQQLIKEGEH